MKVNDSGMPAEDYWNTLFNIELIINWLKLGTFLAPIVEIGCGYGTFTIPMAKNTKSKIICYDIDQEMIDITRKNLDANGLTNYELINCDILEKGINQKPNSCSLVLLFNILHFKERAILLNEAKKVITKKGIIAIIHWRKDIQTPRGPALEIRPSADDIIQDAKTIGLRVSEGQVLLEPYHWGLKLTKGD